jgi:2-polyprenyl-3-methyl-5-hydroxy-6-metoxy-1,4-benzoquinol methylase
MNKEYTFDYSSIPLGFYDKIAKERKGIRSFWHYLKFQRIIDYIQTIPNASKIIDYGCFCGTFLGMLDHSKYSKQLGLDILEEQINYANSMYKNENRSFKLVKEYSESDAVEKSDVITVVEVIEHLELGQINEILDFANKNLNKGGKLIITTPNYFSTWPILEIILNKISEVNYEEQHITKFTYYNIDKKIRSINKDFSTNFETEFLTTSHFLTPFLAQLSFEFAAKLSKFAPHNKWSFPLGNIIMVCFTKK